MPLVQLHHQPKDFAHSMETEMCSQRDVTGHDEIMQLLRETQVTHPLTEGMQWLVVTEESEHFVWAASEGQ